MIKYIITDWASNEIRFNKSMRDFDTFLDAEDYLSEQLGDSYEQDRGEYYIIEIEYN
jgi:hypothetical protein